MADNNPTVPIVVEASSAKKQGRQAGSKGYTGIEELLVAKAFIKSSEDPIKGASQCGREFENSMGKNYALLVQQQVNADRLRFQQDLRLTKRAQMQVHGQVNSVEEPDFEIYPQRKGSALYIQWKKKIAPGIMKFQAIQLQFDKDSGDNADTFFSRCAKIYQERNNKVFEHRAILEYLQGHPKWFAWKAKEEESKKKKEKQENQRPIGNKAAKQAAKDEAVMKRTVQAATASFVDMTKPSAAPAESDERRFMYSAIGQGIQQAISHLATQSLDTPTRQALATARAKVEIEKIQLEAAEMAAKRRKLEADLAAAAVAPGGSNEQEEEEDDNDSE